MDHDTILICTEGEALEGALAELLRGAGHEILPLSSGEEVLEACRQHDVPLAILDLEAPGIDGAAFLLELHKIRPAMEAIFMHGAPTDKHWRSLMHAGAFDLLTKPFGEERFLRSLRGALSRHRVQVKKEELLTRLMAKEQTLAQELATAEEEIKNLRTGAGVEKAMEARIHLLEEERDRLRDTLVGKIKPGSSDEETAPETGDGPEKAPEPPRDGEAHLRIRYPSRLYSILNFFFLAGAFLMAFSAVFLTGRFSAGVSDRIRLALRGELVLFALVWVEGGLLVKLHAMLSYFHLNPLVDEFETRLRLRERIYAILGAALLVGALLAHGSALTTVYRALSGPPQIALGERIARFLGTAAFHSYQLEMMASAILPALTLLFLVLRLNLRYHENLEQHLQKKRTQNLLEKF